MAPVQDKEKLMVHTILNWTVRIIAILAVGYAVVEIADKKFEKVEYGEFKFVPLLEHKE